MKKPRERSTSRRCRPKTRDARLGCSRHVYPPHCCCRNCRRRRYCCHQPPSATAAVEVNRRKGKARDEKLGMSNA